VSRQLHQWREVRSKPFALPIPFIRWVGRTFQLIECSQTWGEYRVFFHDDAGQFARLPRQWTDLVADDPTVIVAIGNTVCIALIEVTGRLR
jgi:hypothetical protein